MSVYLVALIEVTDAEAYAAYQEKGLPTLAAAGGRVVAAGPPTTLEGEDFPPNSAIVEFESLEAALAWYHSAAYQEAIPLRTTSSKAWTMAVLPGFRPG